jgi:hypothetical protein
MKRSQGGAKTRSAARGGAQKRSAALRRSEKKIGSEAGESVAALKYREVKSLVVAACSSRGQRLQLSSRGCRFLLQRLE